jgi:predicted XRE-type DNA-binding protein
LIIVLVFSSDDRSPSASTSNGKQNKNIISNQNPSTQLKQEQIRSAEEIKRPDINFVEKNIERIRNTSLKNKYASVFGENKQ